VRALVVGNTGQDGRYLDEQLRKRGAEVFGINRRGLFDPDGNPVQPLWIGDPAAMRNLIAELAPDRIYYLAAYHHSSDEPADTDPLLKYRSLVVHATGFRNCLEGVVAAGLDTHLVYASSAHVFGAPEVSPQTEDLAYEPLDAYGSSKALGLRLCQFYRRLFGVHASGAILYTHESPRRAPRFLSARIARTVAAIAGGRRRRLAIADPQAVIDWGYAPEYTDALYRMGELDKADDFIVATGQARRVADFLAAAFSHAGLDWHDHVDVTPERLQRRPGGAPLVGDSTRLREATGWKPRTGLQKLAHIMVDAAREAPASGQVLRVVNS